MDEYKKFFESLQLSIEKETKDVPSKLEVSKYQLQYLLRENLYIYRMAREVEQGRKECVGNIITLSEKLDEKIFEIMGKKYNFRLQRDQRENKVEKEDTK